MRYILSLSIIVLFTMASMCSDGNQTANDTNETEKNKAVVVRMHDELMKGNFGILDEVLADNYTRYCQSAPKPLWVMHGIDRMKVFYEGYFKAIPEMTEKIDIILAEGDKVAYKTTIKGTQTGRLGRIPPTDKSFKLDNIYIHRFKDGKIVESWISWDNVAMLTQLGVMEKKPEDQP